MLATNRFARFAKGVGTGAFSNFVRKFGVLFRPFTNQQYSSAEKKGSRPRKSGALFHRKSEM